MERKLIAVAVSTALGLPLAANAVEFSASGHINRALLIVDQSGYAQDGNLQHVDGGSSPSRFRFTGSGELDNGLTASVNLEYGAGGNANDNPTLRHSAISIASAGGVVSIGHTSTASDGMMFASLGGPSWMGGVSAGCLYFSADSAIGCTTHNGPRRPIVKYDTPPIGPASIGVSVGNDDYWDSMAKIAGSFGESGYDLRVGYIGDNGSGEDVVATSGSVKFPQGTTVTASWGQNDDADTEHQHVRLDHSYGAGSIGVHYRQGEDGDMNGSSWGIGFGHGLGNGATAYAGFRLIEGDDIEEANAFFAGMRVTFN